MSSTIWEVLTLAVSGSGSAIAVLAYNRTRSQDRATGIVEDQRRIDEQAAALAALAEKVTLLEKARDRAEETAARVADLTGRVGILDRQIEVFWRNVALDVSKILHSPHAGWEGLDALLEKFQGRDITGPEMDDLGEQLRDIVEGRWEPGGVTRGDQVAASLLLRAIEQTRP